MKIDRLLESNKAIMVLKYDTYYIIFRLALSSNK